MRISTFFYCFFNDTNVKKWIVKYFLCAISDTKVKKSRKNDMILKKAVKRHESEKKP